MLIKKEIDKPARRDYTDHNFIRTAMTAKKYREGSTLPAPAESCRLVQGNGDGAGIHASSIPPNGEPLAQ